MAASGAFRSQTQWDPLAVTERRDNLVTDSALGDPRLVGLERVRELSGFTMDVELGRRVLATIAKTLLPLGLLTLILFGALNFPPALVKEKVTVAVTAALSGAVLLAAINSQLGAVGYVVAIEYVFYVFFALCLLAIVSVLVAEHARAVGHGKLAIRTEIGSLVLFAAIVAGTVGGAWLFMSV